VLDDEENRCDEDDSGIEYTEKEEGKDSMSREHERGATEERKEIAFKCKVQGRFLARNVRG
jgi:hypothetical protein